MEQRPQTKENASAAGSNRTVVILGVVAGLLALAAAVLVAALGIQHSNNEKLVSELNAEKEELTAQVLNLQSDFDSLSTDYADINAQLDTSKEQIAQLLERIQTTEATNRAKIRKYQKELGTLRSIMRNYVIQIDSLNTLNHKLTADAAAARRETATVKRQNQELQKSVDDLSGKVEVAAVIRGRNLRAAAYNKNGKTVNRGNDAKYILVSMSLIENAIAQHGPVRVYIAITSPDGNIMTNAESVSCDFRGTSVQTSASREVDYQGEEIDLGIYFKQTDKFPKGVYQIRAFTQSEEFGTVEMMLR